MTTQLKFKATRDNGRKYKVEETRDSAINTKKFKGHLSSFYYLVLWKNYLKKENSQELALIVQQF